MTDQDVHIEEHKSWDTLPPAEWDALTCNEDFYLSHAMLGSVERVAAVPFRYFLLRRGGALVAGLVCTFADTSVPWVLGRPDTAAQWCAEEEMPGAADYLASLPGDPTELLMPAVVCGGRHVGGTRALVSATATEEDMRLLLEQAESWARSMGARSTAFLYLDESQELTIRALSSRGYQSYMSGRYSRLPVPPGGFDEYIGQFARQRRKNARAERRKIAERGVEVQLENLSAVSLDRIAELEVDLFHKHGQTHRVAADSRAAMADLLDVLGDRAFVAVATGEGEIRGFGLIAQQADSWHGLRAGFDYAFQGKLPLYYELLYYRLVEEAAERGITEIHYGIGSEAAKRSRGCVASNQYGFILRLEGEPA